MLSQTNQNWCSRKLATDRAGDPGLDGAIACPISPPPEARPLFPGWNTPPVTAIFFEVPPGLTAKEIHK